MATVSPRRYNIDDLVEFAAAVLVEAGLNRRDAQTTARLLVDADARGIGTHGLVRLPPYVQRMEAGLVNRTPSLGVLESSPGFLLIDGDDGLGQVTGVVAVGEAARIARDSGVGIVGVRNAHHLGACGLFAEPLARQGYIGCVLSNAAPVMAPTGGVERRIGSNPLAIAVPRGAGRDPIVVDISLTQTAYGRLHQLARLGQPVPEGWAFDTSGKWITDPTVAAEEGILAPVGGHKGYGLALIVEILAGAWTGSSTLDAVGSMYWDPPMPMRVGHLFVAIDVTRFMPLAKFQETVERLCVRLTSTPRLPNVDRIWIPGEIESECAQRSRHAGVALDDGLCDALMGLGDDAGVPFPSPV